MLQRANECSGVKGSVPSAELAIALLGLCFAASCTGSVTGPSSHSQTFSNNLRENRFTLVDHTILGVAPGPVTAELTWTFETTAGAAGEDREVRLFVFEPCGLGTCNVGPTASSAPGQRSLRLTVNATKEALSNFVRVECSPRGRPEASCSGTDPLPYSLSVTWPTVL